MILQNKRKFASILFVLISFVSMAQGGPCGGCSGGPGACAPCCPNNCGGPPPPPGLPVDNLIFALLVLGIIYGSWQIWKLTKKVD